MKRRFLTYSGVTAALAVSAFAACSNTPDASPGPTAGTGNTAAGTAGASSGGGGATSTMGGSGAGTNPTAGTAGSGTAGTGTGGTGGSGGSGGVIAPACKAGAALNGSGLTVSATDISAFKMVAPPGGNMVKMAYDPVGHVVVILQQDGKMTSFDPMVALPTAAMNQPITTTMAYSSGYTGTGDHRGIVFDKDGNLYVLASNGGTVTIKKGAVGTPRTWTDLVTTGSGYQLGAQNNYNHSFSGIAVSADGKSLYFSSGSRTEHGEDEGPSGVAGNNREVPLTSCILKVPTDTPTVLQNTDAALAPFLFADGTRNGFDLAFNADGDLFGTDNGPDMDLPDEINFLEQGKHYGFPWRFGDVDNPVKVQGFTKEGDKRIRQVYGGYNTYAFDGAFPAPPGGVTFTDPVKNLGPDANFVVASATAAAPTKADATAGLMGITAHRSPLGLAFDTAGASCGDYYKQGFVLSFGPIQGGSIGDDGEDLLLLTLKKADGKYTMNSKQLAKGIKGAIDSVLVGNRLFTIGYGAAGSVFVFALPTP